MSFVKSFFRSADMFIGFWAGVKEIGLEVYSSISEGV